MLLLLTSTLPFLAHDHASAGAFLTCRSHNFHGSIIPEFLSDEEQVRKFCEARQQNELESFKKMEYKNLYKLFVQTPLMQFSPSLIVSQKDCNESIIKPLLETQYFTCMLQRCSVVSRVPLTTGLFQSLSKVRSLIKLDLGNSVVENQHLEIIVNSFPSLKALTIENAATLDPTITFKISSPPPPATVMLRNLTMKQVDPLFVTQFVPHCTNLRKLVLSGSNPCPQLDLLHLSSSLPRLTDLSLERYTLDNIESLKKLVHLSSLHFSCCKGLELSFLTPHSLPRLTTLSLERCDGLSTSSFASLVHAPILYVLQVDHSDFNNDCLQYLENMVHLRKLDLGRSNVVGDSRSLNTLMQNLFQLEELNLEQCCYIGNQGAIVGALYSTHSRLRVLNLKGCSLEDDDLNGIGALKNTLEFLDLNFNRKLTYEALEHCKDLVKLKVLDLSGCTGINDLSPLKDCSNLEELNVSLYMDLTDDSFKVFSEEPNSFPNLRVLDLSYCEKLTEKVFDHLSKNIHLVYRLKELNVEGMGKLLSSSKLKEFTVLDILKILSSSETARTNICQFVNLCQLKGLRQLRLTPFGYRSDLSKDLELELLPKLKNLEGF